MINENARELIDTFSAPQAMSFFLQVLERWRKLSFEELSELAPSYYITIETAHDKALIRNNGYFNHRLETRHLVNCLAFAGAYELNNPSSNTTLEDVQLWFVKAYNAMKQQRNESLRSAVLILTDNDDLSIIISKREEEQQLEAEIMQEDLEDILTKLNPLEQELVEALLEDDGESTHKQIAQQLGIDPAVLCRRLKRIRAKLADLI